MAKGMKDPDILFCEECQEEGKKSKVYSLGYQVQGLGHSKSTFWDEDGKLHKHDSNKYIRTFKCSNGHVWSAIEKGDPCPNPDCEHNK